MSRILKFIVCNAPERTCLENRTVFAQSSPVFLKQVRAAYQSRLWHTSLSSDNLTIDIEDIERCVLIHLDV